MVQDRVCAKKTLALLTVSENSKKEICDYFKIPGDRVSVVYNGWQHFSTDISDNWNQRKNDKYARDDTLPFIIRIYCPMFLIFTSYTL